MRQILTYFTDKNGLIFNTSTQLISHAPKAHKFGMLPSLSLIGNTVLHSRGIHSLLDFLSWLFTCVFFMSQLSSILPDSFSTIFIFVRRRCKNQCYQVQYSFLLFLHFVGETLKSDSSLRHASRGAVELKASVC